MDNATLAHTKWNCKYHIVFAPKFRRQIVYSRIKTEIGKILRSLCETLIAIPPKYGVSQVMGYLKGKSSLMIFDRFAHMKYKYGSRRFRCRGYYVDTVGRNQIRIEEYIRHQLQEDCNADRPSLFKPVDPFTGKPVSTGKKVPEKLL